MQGKFITLEGVDGAGKSTHLGWLVAHLRSHLEAWGGNSSGLGVGNIDPQGKVHPDTYWSDYTVGSVKERPFSEIWTGTDPILATLRTRPRPLKGRCGACAIFANKFVIDAKSVSGKSLSSGSKSVNPSVIK